MRSALWHATQQDRDTEEQLQDPADAGYGCALDSMFCKSQQPTMFRWLRGGGDHSISIIVKDDEREQGSVIKEGRIVKVGEQSAHCGRLWTDNGPLYGNIATERNSDDREDQGTSLPRHKDKEGGPIGAVAKKETS